MNTESVTEPPFDEDRETPLAPDDLFLEGLLRHHFQNSAASRDQMIDTVLNSIECSKQTTSTVPSLQVSMEKRIVNRRKIFQWVSVVAVAGVVLGALNLFETDNRSSQSAYAAVQKSLETAKELVIREYDLAFTFSQQKQKIPFRSWRLYLGGEDRFVLHRQAFLPRFELWCGSNEKESWVIPARGPVLVGNRKRMKKALQEHIGLEADDFCTTTILQNMLLRYELSEQPRQEFPLEDETENSETKLNCRYILATKKTDQDRGAERIELWISPEDGTIRRLEMEWGTSQPSALKQLTLSYRDTPEKPKNFFEHAAHHETSRTVLTPEM